MSDSKAMLFSDAKWLMTFGFCCILFWYAVVMTVKIDPSGRKETRWHEYVIRFVAG